MGRFPQNANGRGSLLWIQKAVNKHPDVLNRLLLPQIAGAKSIAWRSPLESDELAEYRDSAFLERIGLDHLAEPLGKFWPIRGPQWDALGTTDAGDIVLVEAKAHINELVSGGSKAEAEASVSRIDGAFSQTIAALKAVPQITWTGPLYQTANRIAHLYFLNSQGVSAWLALVCFVGDETMKGPNSADEWRGALHLANRMLGLPSSHPLSRRILYVFPNVSELD